MSVTVGLPVYNGAEFLEGALASLSKQTFKDFKIIVSDNASTDATPEILARWQRRDSRISYHRQDENIGVVANFDWVLEQADTPWFMFGAHDDTWSETYIESLFNVATKRPGIVTAAPQMVLFREEGKPVNRRNYIEQDWNPRPVRRIRHALRTAHTGWYHGLHDRSALIEAFRSVKRFNHTWSLDFIMICHLILSGETTGSNEAIYYKRMAPQSEELYRPKTAREHFTHYRDFMKETFSTLLNSPLSVNDKISLIPSVLGYCSHGEKPKRIAKYALLGVAQSAATLWSAHGESWQSMKKKD